jgi:hypothetical protein
MKKRTAFASLVIMATVFTTACDEDPLAPHISRDQLLAAPSTLELTGYPLQVETFLSRDFMPVAPPNGRPLTASFRIDLPLSSLPIEEAFIWVLNGDSTWSKKATITSFSGYTDISISGGPKWGPGIAVDTVLGIRDYAGELHLVLRRGVEIRSSE